MKSFHNFVLLVDVDNTTLTEEQLKKIINKIEAIGDITYIKFYGCNDKRNKEFADLINGRCCDTASVLRTKIRSRKSVMDTRIIVDGMKIAASGVADSFAIIAGDGDFGYFLSALKAMGMYVAGRFNSDVNISFCDIYLVDFEQNAENNSNV